MLETADLPKTTARLPDDLLEIICTQAASEDRYAAYALALTCQRVCRWTAKARWHTIVIRSVRQLLSLWRAVYAVPEEIYEAFTFHLFEQQSDCTIAADTQSMLVRHINLVQLGSAHDRLTKGISYPSDGKPHKHIKHLYIDTTANTKSSSGEDVQTSMSALKRTGLLFMSTNIFGRSDYLSDPTRILNRWTCKDKSVLHHLSLGVDETDSLDWGALNDLSVDELTLVLRRDYFGDLHVDMTSSVRRLHLVGQDPKSELTGVEPPWALLRCLTSPILDTTLSPIPTLSKRKISHIRYDTRRFSLKPAEITAKRLRPLLQECTVAPSFHIDELIADQRPTAATAFQFNGPRHAAPARGAGSFTMQQTQARLTPVNHLAARYGAEEPVACYLEQVGVGQLDLLRFAWEPMMSTPIDDHPPWYKQSLDTSLDKGEDVVTAIVAEGMQSDSGGWPAEMRGAWAERSEKRSALSAFTYELRDAINILYGWNASTPIDDRAAQQHRRNVAFSAEGSGLMVESAQTGISRQDEDMLRKMALLVKANVPNWRRNHPEWSEGDTDFLRFGIRAPNSLLRLGGKAAFTSDDRLRLFEDRARGGPGAWPAT